MKRYIIQLMMYFTFNGIQRAKLYKAMNCFKDIGKNVMIQSRKVPLYPELIRFGNNIRVASDVHFITHDVIHNVLNNMEGKNFYCEKRGCINIEDNVFIGANTIIMYDVNIGYNTIIAAGSVVTKSLEPGYVWGGIPAKKLGEFKEIQKNRLNNLELDNEKLWENFFNGK